MIVISFSKCDMPSVTACGLLDDQHCPVPQLRDSAGKLAVLDFESQFLYSAGMVVGSGYPYFSDIAGDRNADRNGRGVHGGALCSLQVTPAHVGDIAEVEQAYHLFAVDIARIGGHSLGFGRPCIECQTLGRVGAGDIGLELRARVGAAQQVLIGGDEVVVAYDGRAQFLRHL